MSLPLESVECDIGEGFWLMEFQPTRGEARGQEFLKGFASNGHIARFGSADRSGDVAIGSEVDGNEAAWIPVRRDLENGGTTKAAVREKHFFAEVVVIGGGDDLCGDAGEFGVTLAIGGMEEERDEGGTRRNDVDAELAGEIVTERSGAHLGDGEAAGGHHEDRSREAGRFAAD